MEMQRYAGGFLLAWDRDLYDERTNACATARTTDLNEDLGQIQHIFADKTGTLTVNEMTFKACSIAGVVYNSSPDGTHLYSTEYAPQLDDEAATATHSKTFRSFFQCLSVCNGVRVETDEVILQAKSEGYAAYLSSSPDEEALVRAACAVEADHCLAGRTQDMVTVKIAGEEKQFEVLHTMKFSSLRKRMSILVRCPPDSAEGGGGVGQVVLFCMGADSALLPRVREAGSEDEAASNARVVEQIDRFSRQGLRTLVQAARVFSPAEVAEVLGRLEDASSAADGRAAALDAVYEALENDFALLGATAVEDRLQPGVKEAMHSFREAGITLWVLTGDKAETAVVISISSGHFTPDTRRLNAVGLDDAATCARVLADYRLQCLQAQGQQSGSARGPPATGTESSDGTVLVVDGRTLSVALSTCKELFKEVAWWVLVCQLAALANPP